MKNCSNYINKSKNSEHVPKENLFSLFILVKYIFLFAHLIKAGNESQNIKKLSFLNNANIKLIINKKNKFCITFNTI